MSDGLETRIICGAAIAGVCHVRGHPSERMSDLRDRTFCGSLYVVNPWLECGFADGWSAILCNKTPELLRWLKVNAVDRLVFGSAMTRFVDSRLEPAALPIGCAA